MSVPDRTITVTRHALDRMRSRYRAEDVTDYELEAVAALEVRDAFIAGRVANHKQPGFGLYREPKSRRQLPEGQRFVWTADEKRAYVIRREQDHDVVITALHRAWAA